MSEPGPPPSSSQPRPGAGFRYLEHTADLVVQAWGHTRAEAIRQVLLATAELVIDPGEIATRGCLSEVTIEAPDGVSAMVQAINEYLYLLDTKGLLVADIKVTDLSPEPVRLKICFAGDMLTGGLRDYVVGAPAKAATYHEAALLYDARLRQWVARVILDI